MKTLIPDKRSAAAFFTLVFLIAALALAAQTISFFVANPKEAKYDLKASVPSDFLLAKPYQDTPFTDCIYYQFDSDNGYDFYCHYIMADVGIISKKYLLDYKLHYPDGRFKVFGGKFDADQGSIAADRFEWRIGPNYTRGDSSTHQLHIESGALIVDVTMKAVVPAYRVGKDGMLYIEPERKKWGQFTYFPLFRAEGAIKDGATVIPITGWGYGNRANENFIISDVTSLHTALRWQKEGLGFDVHDYQAFPEYGGQWLPILIVYNKGRLIHVSQNYQKEVLDYITEEKTGLKIPAGYRITSQGPGIEVKIEFAQVKLADYNDPLVWLGTVEKYLLNLVSDPPLDLRFDGQVKITVTTAEGTIEKQGPGHGLALLTQ